MLLSIGLRPFFLLAGLYACLAMAAWLVWLATGIAGVPAVVWHGHEMVFGFAAAVIAGFLLTAVPNWTATRPLSGAPLAALCGLWIAGRAAVWLSAGLPPGLVAGIELLFLPALGGAVAAPLIRAKALRNAPFLVLLAILFAADLLVHLELMGWTEDSAATGNRLGVNLVIVLIAIVGGRVVPAFTGNWLTAQRTGVTVARNPLLDGLAIAATALVLLADLAGAVDRVVGALALAAAAAHLARLAGWRTRHVLGTPILWILHLGYGWLVVGFACRALALLGGVITDSSALHALTVGAVGSMTLGVMSRAALGHTGRALVVAPTITAAYLLVSLAALLRLAGPVVLPGAGAGTMLVSGALWITAFAVFSALYWPILTRPAAA